MLLDTSVVIDRLRGLTEARTYFETLKRRPSISVLTISEVLAGARTRREETDAELFFASVKVHPVDGDIARRAGAFVRLYRKSHNVELADALIAATAEHHGLELATLNVKHFPMFRKLKPAY